MGGRGGGSSGRQGNAVTDWRDAAAVDGKGFPIRRAVPVLGEKRQAQVERDALGVISHLDDGDFMRLTQMRNALSAKGYSVGEQDAAIAKIALRRDVRIIPIANLKSLSPDDRRSALFIGGEFKHAIGMARR